MTQLNSTSTNTTTQITTPTPSPQKFTIRPITTPDDVTAARAILRTFNTDLGYSLTFQNFEAELASLPGLYAAPTGVFLLVWATVLAPSSPRERGDDGSNEERNVKVRQQAVACMGVRPLPEHYGPHPHEERKDGELSVRNGAKVCEAKRLFVLPEARGMRIAGALVDRGMEIARELGYEEMWLDTLPHMNAAKHIYRVRGFVDIPPYNETPLDAPIFLGRKL